MMAGCEKGYDCDRCGAYVENVRESELYLRYVLGAVPYEALTAEPERHIRCCPEFAQFIVHPDFPPVPCADPDADKRRLPEAVRLRQERIFTAAWRRLQEVSRRGLPVDEYPLDERDLRHERSRASRGPSGGARP